MTTKIDTEVCYLPNAERDQQHRKLERDAAWRTVIRNAHDAEDFDLLVDVLGLNESEEQGE